MDMLIMADRIKNSILLGESQFREFKSAFYGTPPNKQPRDKKEVADDIARTLVAFANADGGELLIGVEDDGTITGHQFIDSIKDYLLQVPKTHIHNDTPLQGYKNLEIIIDSKKILYFYVDKSLIIHQTSEGKCVQRKDLQSVPVAFHTLQVERSETQSREYDRQFVDGASVNDLDLSLIQKISNSILGGMSFERMLQYLDLADYSDTILKLRRAALLLFAKEISRWHPRCEVRVLKVHGSEILTGKDYNVTSDEKVSGNIIELMTKAWEKIRIHLVQNKLHGEGIFVEHIMYPEDACREALTNAIAHRDYHIEGRGIEVFVFDDKMVFTSPGGLLSSISIQDLVNLKGSHQSRNTRIARVLKEIGYMREMGEGIRRIFVSMEDKELMQPTLSTSFENFSIELSHKSVFSEDDQRLIHLYAKFNLTREETCIILLCKSGKVVSPMQIYDNLKLTDWDEYRKIVSGLQYKGILYSTLNAKQKASKSQEKHISKREVPRLMTRTPETCEAALNELLSVVVRLGRFETINRIYIEDIKQGISNSNIYNDAHANIHSLLRLIDLINEENRPTSRLRDFWNANSSQNYKSRNNRPMKPQQVKQQQQEEPLLRDIYVENVEYHTSEEELMNAFGNFGHVEKVSIPKDYFTGLGRGFAFVRMTVYDDAVRAIKSLNCSIMNGRELSVQFSQRAK